MNRRHGSCKGSWDIYGCLYTDPETWILQRFLRYIWMLRPESETWIRRHGSCRGSWDIKMLRHESGDVDVDLAEHPWDTKMLRHESEDVDLVADPEIHMAAELWIRQHGSCIGSWDMDADTWIQRRGSCSGAWDTKMLRHESEGVDLVADPHWWTLRHESGTWLLQRILRYEVYRRHKHMSCKQLSCDLSRCLVLGGWRRLMSRIFCCCPPTHCLGSLAGVIFVSIVLMILICYILSRPPIFRSWK